MNEWRDISTAPKDGEACLIYCPDADEPGIILASYRRYVNADDPEDTHEAWYDFWDDEAPELDVTPTHWKPLPDPPKDAGP